MRLVARSRVAASSQQLFDWHMRPGAFQRLVPPWESVRQEGLEAPVTEGSLRRLRVSPLGIPWLALHDQIVPGRQFRDVQQSGPFRSWAHCHRFEPQSEGSLLVDDIDFRLPLEPFSRVASPMLRAQFRRMFLWRHWSTAWDLQLQTRFSASPLRILVSGASGLIGRNLVSFLRTAGHQVFCLVRRAPVGPDEIAWNPLQVNPSPEMEGFDAVFHLAGRGLLSGTFTARHRQDVYQSRVRGTANLAHSLAALKAPPQVFVSASGVGYYGQSSRTVSTEDSPRGDDFLAELCLAWEKASQALSLSGCRCVQLRLGPVLTLESGILPPAYWATLFGPNWHLGDGQQALNWVSLIDVMGVCNSLLHWPDCHGPLNVVAPVPHTLGDLTDRLARLVGGRPRIRIPEAPVRKLLGVRSLLLPGASQVVPRRLQELGYEFIHHDLERCLRHSLGRYGPQDNPPDWDFQFSG